MLAGSHFAGIAIEQSMLGAAHACSNPLTARFGLAHGLALSILLPHVVRWNSSIVGDRYAALDRIAEALATRLARYARAGGLGGALHDHGVPADALPGLADQAATQWTGHVQSAPVRCGGRAGDLPRGALSHRQGPKVRFTTEGAENAESFGHGQHGLHGSGRAVLSAIRTSLAAPWARERERGPRISTPTNSLTWRADPRAAFLSAWLRQAAAVAGIRRRSSPSIADTGCLRSLRPLW